MVQDGGKWKMGFYQVYLGELSNYLLRWERSSRGAVLMIDRFGCYAECEVMKELI